MAKATSISAENLASFTKQAVRAAAPSVPGRTILRGPIMGFILAQELAPARALSLATDIASGVATTARSAGIAGLRPKPVVVRRPGNITVGFIAQELGVTIR
jgi:hypothetical protein